jgi:iron complex outermembrane receptor protein
VLSRFSSFFLESKFKYTAKQYRAPERVITARQFNEASAENINLFEDNGSSFDFMPPPSGYLLWNVSTGVSLKSDKVRYDFRVAAENVLNTSYREYTNRFRYYADDLGRNFIISVKCIF